jgi:hypothetical protein
MREVPAWQGGGESKVQRLTLDKRSSNSESATPGRAWESTRDDKEKETVSPSNSLKRGKYYRQAISRNREVTWRKEGADDPR